MTRPGRSPSRRSVSEASGSWIEVDVKVRIRSPHADLDRLSRELVRAKGKLAASDAARALGVNPKDLPRKLRLAVGMNYREYRRQIRLQLAAWYLRHTPMSIEDITIEAGYERRETLDRTFSRFVGMSPARFRHSCDSRHKIWPIQPIDCSPDSEVS